MTQPLVSVIMSVYKESFSILREAIDSILGQTLQEFEFIIVNDNPKNPNLDYLKQLEDNNKNVLLICNEKNQGLPASLNIGVKAAKGKYIARMDADDISLPNRLEEQMKFLIDNNYDLIGCYIERIDNFGKTIGLGKLPNKPKTLRRLLPYATIAFHPTWFAKSEILKNNPYNNLFINSQDYELLHRLIRKDIVISNLSLPLLKYRTNPDVKSARKSYIQYKLHKFVNTVQDRNKLNKIVSDFLKENDGVKEIAYFTCREKVLNRKFDYMLIPCLFNKEVLHMIFNLIMSRFIKNYD